MQPPPPLRLWIPPEPEALYDRPEYPGHGMPQRQGELAPPHNAWARLTRGQPLGKKAIMIYDATIEGVQAAPVPFFQLRGDDQDAHQMNLVIAPPRVLWEPFTDLIANANTQNLSGSQDNAEVSDADFPDTASPITWPPFEAVIEFGVGGALVRFVVDIVNGTSINIPGASYLQVFAALAQTSATGIVGTSAAYEFAAFVGPGFGRSHAQKTVYVGNVGAGAESLIFEVPRFAKRAYLVSNDPTVAPQVTVATLRFWQNVAGAGNAHASNTGNFLFTGNQVVAADVPAGSAYFSVLSGMGATARFSVVYDLAF